MADAVCRHFLYRYFSRKAERSVMANISVVGRIVSDDIELKISANNRPYLRFDLAERTGKGAYARSLLLALSPLNLQKENCTVVR